jgi:outer membrane receptor for ferrienterochelin and colicins
MVYNKSMKKPGRHTSQRICILFFTLFLMPGITSFAQEQSDTSSTDLMSLSLEQLLNVKIKTASKYEEKESDAPAIVSVLTRDEISRFGGMSLVNILNRIPGLISSYVSFSDVTTIAPRGDQVKGTSGHVLFLLNGRPVREILEGGISCDILNVFPVDIIERIEVIKGPGSVLYGSDAFSAVINIITRNAEKNEVSIKTITQAGWGYGGSCTTTLSIRDAKILLGARYLEKPVFRKYYESTSALTDNDTVYLADVPNKGPGFYFGINYHGLSLMTQYNDFTSNSMENHGQNWKKLFSNLGYSTKVSSRWRMDLNAGITHAKLKAVNVNERTSDNIIIEWTNFITITGKSNLVVGGLYGKIKGNETLYIPGLEGVVSAEGNRNSYALYTQIDYALTKKLKFIAGVQANKPQDIKTDLVPRVGAIWQPLKGFTVKALYSEAFRAPSITELYLISPRTLGNENLKPEKVASQDLGLNYQNEVMSIGFNIFYSDQSDIIVRKEGVYTNLQEIRFWGAEAEGKYYVNNKIYLNASVLYQTNKSDTSMAVTAIAAFSSKAGISYVSGRGLRVSLFDIYQGKLDIKYAWRCEPEDLAYNLLNLYCEYSLNTLPDWHNSSRFSLYAQIDNLLDDKYIRYDQRGVTSPAYSGREIFFGLNFTF